MHMKHNMFSAVLAFGALGLLLAPALPVRAQSAVVAGDSDSTIVIRRNDEPPVALDNNKGVKGAAVLPAKAETTGRTVQDAHGNEVRKIMKD
jgi:hypothetical protein